MLKVFGSALIILGIIVMSGCEHEDVYIMSGVAGIGMIGFTLGFIMLRLEK